MNTYDRIAQIIRYLDDHRSEQPDLAILAEHAALSRFQLHRLFSSWAGITPKDFLQCLTLAHARELLRQGETILDAALGAGLSGPGRLHDLCVNLEAASPGELKLGGAGWTIIAGFADTPFGPALIGQSPRGICHLAFCESNGDGTAWAALTEAWPGAKLRRDDAAAASVATQAFERSASRHPALRAFVRGTEFQVRVWRALLRVPPGALVTYGGLAKAIGQPTAARAVGSAIGQNSLAYLIPCHRVIRETGIFGNYRWDPVRKRALLAWESGPQLAAASLPARPLLAETRGAATNFRGRANRERAGRSWS